MPPPISIINLKTESLIVYNRYNIRLWILNSGELPSNIYNALVSPGNTHLIWKVQPQFLSKVSMINDKSFTVSPSGCFSPIQLIFNSKIKRYLSKYHFPNCCDFTFTPNHWYNFERCVSLLKMVPYLKGTLMQIWKSQYMFVLI